MNLIHRKLAEARLLQARVESVTQELEAIEIAMARSKTTSALKELKRRLSLCRKKSKANTREAMDLLLWVAVHALEAMAHPSRSGGLS